MHHEWADSSRSRWWTQSLTCSAEVTGQGQLQPSSQGNTIHSCNGRHRQRCYRGHSKIGGKVTLRGKQRGHLSFSHPFYLSGTWGNAGCGQTDQTQCCSSELSLSGLHLYRYTHTHTHCCTWFRKTSVCKLSLRERTLTCTENLWYQTPEDNHTHRQVMGQTGHQLLHLHSQDTVSCEWECVAYVCVHVCVISPVRQTHGPEHFLPCVGTTAPPLSLRKTTSGIDFK